MRCRLPAATQRRWQLIPRKQRLNPSLPARISSHTSHHLAHVECLSSCLYILTYYSLLFSISPLPRHLSSFVPASAPAIRRQGLAHHSATPPGRDHSANLHTAYTSAERVTRLCKAAASRPTPPAYSRSTEAGSPRKSHTQHPYQLY